jgi:hypothetical protein
MIALTSYRASGAEKVAQVLLTVDGLAFIPVITAIIVGARLTGTVRGAASARRPRHRGGSQHGLGRPAGQAGHQDRAGAVPGPALTGEDAF